MKAIVLPVCAIALLFLAIGASISAHAVLMESRPTSQDHISGSDVPVLLRFNCLVDQDRSKLTLIRPDNSLEPLTLKKPSPPDTLTANISGLKAGEYSLRWLVLASDGHITQGVIPFKVDRP
jgi:methionine-rich copper-binding protein CopC